MTSVLSSVDQKRDFIKQVKHDGEDAIFRAEVRYGDDCKNGHNTFSVTGTLFERKFSRGEEKLRLLHGPNKGKVVGTTMGGCLHEEVEKYVPELKDYIKWHLFSTDGPMHYIENAKYWAGGCPQWCKGGPSDPPNLEHFKSTIVYGVIEEEASAEQLMAWVKDGSICLPSRLNRLMEEFQKAVESLGFVY